MADLGEYRIGLGTDIHALKSGRKLMLAGVEVPHTQGLVGHTDADIVIHAVIDAILGALGASDIGEWFPDNEEVTKGIASHLLLNKVMVHVKERGYQIVNVDIIIHAEAPRLSPHKDAMRNRLAEIMMIATDQCNIKAKTEEGFDAVGQKKAMRSQAIILLRTL